MEEYCSYILSRERNLQEFIIPGSSVIIEKSELLSSMRKALRDNGDNDYDYDSLLLNTLLHCVNKDHLGKNLKFDENMDAVIGNIRKRVRRISTLCDSMERPLPFSYERIFEILVYYLRLITNILKSGKGHIVHYDTADISPEAVLFILNSKLSMDNLDSEWETKGWEAFQNDFNPLYISMVNNYFRFLLLATYIRYCEIRNK